MKVLLFGVTNVGKTTIGEILANKNRSIFL